MSESEFEHDGWAIAVFVVRCDEHAGPIPPGTPYRLHRELPGRMRRICRDCAEPAAPGLSDGTSPCGWCGETPPKDEPWTTVHVATTDSRACLECWTRWDQGLPIGREAV